MFPPSNERSPFAVDVIAFCCSSAAAYKLMRVAAIVFRVSMKPTDDSGLIVDCKE